MLSPTKLSPSPDPTASPSCSSGFSLFTNLPSTSKYEKKHNKHPAAHSTTTTSFEDSSRLVSLIGTTKTKTKRNKKELLKNFKVDK